MSLFQFGFTVKETVNSQNSAAHSQPANAGACAFLPEQEATNLGSEEYNEVVLSVGDAVDPNKNLSSKRKRGNYNHYSPELRAQIGKYASENGNLRALPANMTHFFQPLDLTVNREAKKFMKDQFTAWYSAQIHTQLDSGVALDDVDVDMRLSVLKPIHATWLVSMFNHLSSSEGRISIAKGWKKAGISEVIDGKELPPEDPFEDL